MIKLKAGNEQSMVFLPGDAPPIREPNYPKEDTIIGAKEVNLNAVELRKLPEKCN